MMDERSVVMRKLKHPFEDQSKQYRVIARYLEGAKLRTEKSADSPYKDLARGIFLGMSYTISALDRDNQIMKEMFAANLLTEKWLKGLREAIVRDLEYILSEIERVKGQGIELRKTKRKVERLKTKIAEQNRRYKDVLSFLDEATEKATNDLKKEQVKLRRGLTYIG
jgi:hypothetical protein